MKNHHQSQVPLKVTRDMLPELLGAENLAIYYRKEMLASPHCADDLNSETYAVTYVVKYSSSRGEVGSERGRGQAKEE